MRRARLLPTLLALLGLAACHEQGQTHLARGNVLQNQGKLDLALVEYKAAAQDDASASTPWLRMGDILYGQGKKGQALAAYHQATARNPGQLDAWIGLARIQSEQGHDAEARASLDRALAVRPKNLFARLSRAQLALQDGDVKAALEDARIASRLEDSSPSVLFVYGSAMAANKDYSGAEAAFERLESLDAHSPLAPYGRARLSLARGDRPGAIAALRQAVALAPGEKGQLATDPTLALLRGDPAFDALVGAAPAAPAHGG